MTASVNAARIQRPDSRFRRAAADRKRRQRAREANGRIYLRVEVDEAALCAAMLDAGLIAPGDLDDPRKLGRALSRVVEILTASDELGLINRSR